MKIKYEFATETVEIEVTEEWANIMLELDRQEYNSNRRETRRHCSLDALNLDDAYLPSDEDVVRDVITKIENERLYEAISRLSPRQKYLIEQVYFNGRTYSDIAREEHKDKSTIRESVMYALKNLKKYLS